MTDWTKFSVVRSQDRELEELWEQFGDEPMNPETECIEQPFLCFPAGTHREVVWKFFDERYSKGVYGLMFPDDEDDGLDYIAQVNGCPECSQDDCGFNRNGWCRLPLVKSQMPKRDDHGLCSDCMGVSTTDIGDCDYASLERKAQILDTALDYFGENETGHALYETLAGVLGMDDDEILAAGFFTLKEFMNREEDA